MAQDITVGIRLKGDAKGLVGEVKLSADSLKAFRGEAEQTDRTLASVAAKVGHYGAAFVGLNAAIGSLRQYTQVTDTFTQLESKLKLVSTEAWQVGRAQQELLQIAQASRTPLADIGDVYTRIARSAQQLGLTQGQVLSVTDSVAKAMAISGGSAESMRAALMQLGQGLASGTLRGEELNSVMEQTPRLAQALADGLGISIGELRKWGEQGKLTTDVVVGALTKAGPRLAEEFAKITPTVDGSLTVLRNGMGVLISEFDKGAGASESIARKLSDLGAQAQSLAGKAKEVGEFVAPFLKLAIAASSLLVAGRAISLIGGAAGKIASIGGAVNPGAMVAAGTIGLSGALMANRQYGVNAQEQEIARLERKRAGFGDMDPNAAALDRQIEQARARLQTARSATVGNTPSVPVVGLDLPTPPTPKLSDEAQGVLLRLSGVSDSYVKDVQSLSKAYADGVLPADQYEKAIAKLVETETKYGKDAKAAAEAALKARQVALEVQGKTEAAAMKDRIDRLQFEFDQGLMGEKEYAAARLRVQLEAFARREQLVNQEIALVSKKDKGDPQQVAKLKGDLGAIGMERQAAEREAAQAGVVADRTAARQLLEVRAELMRSRGDEAGAFGAQFDERYAMTRARAGRDGNAALTAEIDALRQVGMERATLADLTREYERTRDRLSQVEQSAQSQVIIGLIGEGEARVRVRTETQRAGSELSASLLPKIKEFATTVKDPLVVAQLEAMTQKIAEMARVVDESPFAGFAAGAREYLGQVGTEFERMRGVATRVFKGMEDTLVSFVKTGKLDFSSLADSIISDMIRIQIQEMYTKPLAKAAGSGLAGLFGAGGASSFTGDVALDAAIGLRSARGNVFEDGSVTPFAKGGIFTSPRTFRFASGGTFKNGLMAEAGPEAIMPLARGADGKLGVAASGGAAQSIKVQIVNESGSKLQVESATPSFDPEGMVVTVVLGDMAKNGPISQGLQGRFGLRPGG